MIDELKKLEERLEQSKKSDKKNVMKLFEEPEEDNWGDDDMSSPVLGQGGLLSLGDDEELSQAVCITSVVFNM